MPRYINTSFTYTSKFGIALHLRSENGAFALAVLGFIKLFFIIKLSRIKHLLGGNDDRSLTYFAHTTINQSFLIIEMFPLFQEIDLLIARLENGFEYVEKFTICEFGEAHRGTEKPLYWNLSQNWNILEKYQLKIAYLPFKQFPKLYKLYPAHLVANIKLNVNRPFIIMCMAFLRTNKFFHANQAGFLEVSQQYLS
ncbi:unnamed protein product [Didymodactylos carnosus]|uniref:Uncharacterized protein n=1 Tax=Didymodactylos carnosus TaxID=1234261 RepID=A0A815JLS1_9BILA|nr:unnamed protein product [Didymodactylos carnosus]CAF4275164.1 unnamed protein product [Didymodactylos carnosus]